MPPLITSDEAAAAARAVVHVVARWRLSDAQACEILGGISQRTWSRWKAGQFGRISRDLADRLGMLVGIHAALRVIFTDKERGYAWVSRPNAIYGGRSPAEVMADGSMFALARVYKYVTTEVAA
ncbi:hypothetical protein ASE61_11855 [Bosea sp. Root670]|uniref:antitoxin Xre-like helix-turn-helix domain-containing protein n=1 Tax=Bosea sp. Root670 TaxID=1736583 RepID=UPI00071491C7|nr:antitoxin Xre-like helix-turn-helix domain-containing protein [Bosea sp. Root670]KRE03184.1 hypothetical protein ASE61_11855 [Bosea sp. Root670]